MARTSRGLQVAGAGTPDPELSGDLAWGPAELRFREGEGAESLSLARHFGSARSVAAEVRGLVYAPDGDDEDGQTPRPGGHDRRPGRHARRPGGRVATRPGAARS